MHLKKSYNLSKVHVYTSEHHGDSKDKAADYVPIESDPLKLNATIARWNNK